MNKQEMINQLEARVRYNMEQRAYYESLLEKEDSAVWREMVDWFKGKIVAFNIAIEMAEELS